MGSFMKKTKKSEILRKFLGTKNEILGLHFVKFWYIIALVLEKSTHFQMDALLAQLGEHLTLNQGVQGSSPWRRT